MSSYVKKITFQDPVLKKTCHRLVAISDGSEIESFGTYLREKLLQGAPKRSVDAWAGDLSCFFNYYLAAANVLASGEVKFSSTVLAEVIFAYPSYLVYSIKSPNLIAKLSARETGAKVLARTTALRRLSTLKNFLASSAYFQQQIKTLKDRGLIEIDVAQDVFLGELVRKKNLTIPEKNALVQQSMLAGCVRGGARYASAGLFKLPKVADNSDPSKEGSKVEKSFPLSKIMSLLNHAPTYRDRTIWALMAGTGIRTSEAMQLTMDDIDGLLETVKVERKSILDFCDSAFLCEEMAEKLKFKGRNTESVYFLEPFKKIFFDSLFLYLEQERPISCDHHFVFVALGNRAFGRPLFLGDATSHNKAFKSVQSNHLSMDKVFTLHSLRHLYGTYVLNFIPNGKRYGFEIATVQLMMGHSSIKSTQGYAIRDKNLVLAKLAEANRIINNQNSDFTLLKNISGGSLSQKKLKHQE